MVSITIDNDNMFVINQLKLTIQESMLLKSLEDFYKEISKNLLLNATNYFKERNVDHDCIKVPGALEIAPVIKFYHENISYNSNI